jgi:hypothetical protein
LHAIQNTHSDHPYVYILVRADISIEQQIVQAGHAALEAGFRFKRPDVTSSLILLTVPDQAALKAAGERLERNGIEHHMFFEPDFGMGYSALATRPMVLKAERQSMRRYPLYRAPRMISPSAQEDLCTIAPAQLMYAAEIPTTQPAA